MSDDKKIIFSMVGVSKQTPQGKQIIKNMYLSFYYGAKIGIIGLKWDDFMPRVSLYVPEAHQL